MMISRVSLLVSCVALFAAVSGVNRAKISQQKDLCRSVSQPHKSPPQNPWRSGLGRSLSYSTWL